jgi:hypothetical protein
MSRRSDETECLDCPGADTKVPKTSGVSQSEPKLQQQGSSVEKSLAFPIPACWSGRSSKPKRNDQAVRTGTGEKWVFRVGQSQVQESSCCDAFWTLPILVHRKLLIRDVLDEIDDSWQNPEDLPGTRGMSMPCLVSEVLA